MLKAEQMTTLEKKIEHFHRILAGRPGDELTTMALAEATFRRGLKLEALTAYQDLSGSRPVAEAHLAVAEIYWAQGMPHEAYGEIRRLFELDPENVEARLLVNVLQEEALPPEDVRAIMDRPSTEQAFDETRLRLKIQRTIYNRELQERTRNVTLEPGTVIHEYHMEEAKKKLIRVDELLRELERYREYSQTLSLEPPRPEPVSAQASEVQEEMAEDGTAAPVMDELPLELTQEPVEAADPDLASEAPSMTLEPNAPEEEASPSGEPVAIAELVLPIDPEPPLPEPTYYLEHDGPVEGLESEAASLPVGEPAPIPVGEPSPTPSSATENEELLPQSPGLIPFAEETAPLPVGAELATLSPTAEPTPGPVDVELEPIPVAGESMSAGASMEQAPDVVAAETAPPVSDTLEISTMAGENEASPSGSSPISESDASLSLPLMVDAATLATDESLTQDVETAAPSLSEPEGSAIPVSVEPEPAPTAPAPEPDPEVESAGATPSFPPAEPETFEDPGASSAEREPSRLEMAPLPIAAIEPPPAPSFASDFDLSIDSTLAPDLPDIGPDDFSAPEEAPSSGMVDLAPIDMGMPVEPAAASMTADPGAVDAPAADIVPAVDIVQAVAPPTFDDAPIRPDPVAPVAPVAVMPMLDDSTMILTPPEPALVAPPVPVAPPVEPPSPYVSGEVAVPLGLSAARKAFYEAHHEALSALTTSLARTRGVTSIYLVAREGVTIDSVAKDEISEKRVGELVKESFEFLEAFANDPAYWVLECAGGIFVMQKLDDRHVLIAIGQAGANFGALRYTMDKTRTKFEQLLAQAPE